MKCAMPAQATTAMQKKVSTVTKLEYDVCARCGALFDDQGENGWWVADGVWWHECAEKPARIVVRKLARRG
jgi:hypothetical protein